MKTLSKLKPSKNELLATQQRGFRVRGKAAGKCEALVLFSRGPDDLNFAMFARFVLSLAALPQQ
jgi:hypothetical protein